MMARLMAISTIVKAAVLIGRDARPARLRSKSETFSGRPGGTTLPENGRDNFIALFDIPPSRDRLSRQCE